MTIKSFIIREGKYLSFGVTVPHEQRFEDVSVEMFDIRCFLYLTPAQSAAIHSLPSAEMFARLSEMGSWAAVFVRERMKTYISGLKAGTPDEGPMRAVGDDCVAGLRETFGSPLGDFSEMRFGQPELSILGMGVIFGEEVGRFPAYGETYKTQQN